MNQLQRFDHSSVKDIEELDAHQYLTFNLFQDLYAIELLYIKEIIEYGRITPVPMMPEIIKGVINLRGQVVPVVDLKYRFGLGSTEIGKRTGIVIVNVNANGISHDIGVIVDSVSEVLSISPGNLDDAPTFGTKLRSDFIRYMGKVEDDFIVILAIDKVLSISEMAMINRNKKEDQRYLLQ